mgnify:CR=1 FL=1
MIGIIIRLLQLIKAMFSFNLILTRTACLGNDALKLIGNKKYYFLNIQKGRIDYLNKIIVGSCPNIKFGDIDLIIRKDIKSIYLQEAFGYLPFIFPPKYFIFDTYSELTDQEFKPFNNTFSSIYFNYSDLHATFKNSYSAVGLLECVNFYNQYSLFVTNLRSRFTEIPVIFILFPTKFDNREKFKIRYDSIKKALLKVATFYSDIHIIEIPDQLIENTGDLFPYHFTEKSKLYVAKEILKLIK